MLKKIAIVSLFVVILLTNTGAAYAQNQNMGGVTWSGNQVMFGTSIPYEEEIDPKDVDNMLLGGIIECYLTRGDVVPFFTARLNQGNITLPKGFPYWIKFIPHVNFIDVDGLELKIVNKPYLVNSEDPQIEGIETFIWHNVEDTKYGENHMDIFVGMKYHDIKTKTLFWFVSWKSEEDEYTCGSQRILLRTVPSHDDIKTDLDLLEFCQGGESLKYGQIWNYQAAHPESQWDIDEVICNLKLRKENMEVLSFNEDHPEVLTSQQWEWFSQWQYPGGDGKTVAESNMIWVIAAFPIAPCNPVKKYYPSDGNFYVNFKESDDADEYKSFFPYVCMELPSQKPFRSLQMTERLIKYVCPYTENMYEGYALDSTTGWKTVQLPDDSLIYVFDPLMSFPDQITYFWIEGACMRFSKGTKFHKHEKKWLMAKDPNKTMILELINI